MGGRRRAASWEGGRGEEGSVVDKDGGVRGGGDRNSMKQGERVKRWGVTLTGGL